RGGGGRVACGSAGGNGGAARRWDGPDRQKNDRQDATTAGGVHGCARVKGQAGGGKAIRSSLRRSRASCNALECRAVRRTRPEARPTRPLQPVRSGYGVPGASPVRFAVAS